MVPGKIIFNYGRLRIACKTWTVTEVPGTWGPTQGVFGLEWGRQSLVNFAVRRYLTHVITTISSKGQIVLPAELRQRDSIEAGQQFEVERLDRGEYRLVRRAARPNDGVVDWLLACPVKGFFVPIESESTDSL